jgi:fatty-acyl-CoA synthase
MTEVQTSTPANATGSAAKAWLRALELTAQIPRNRDRVMSAVIEELAERWGDAPALLSDHECLTYRGIANVQTNRPGGRSTRVSQKAK